MQPASSADKSSPVLAFQNASARTRTRAEFFRGGAKASTLNETPASFSHPIAHANTAAPTSEPNRPAPKSFTPDCATNNARARASSNARNGTTAFHPTFKENTLTDDGAARDLATNINLVDEEFRNSAEKNYNNKSSGNPARLPANEDIDSNEKFCKSAQNKYNYRAQKASNHMNNLMTYGLAALAIGGLTVGCASALGAGLVPLAVVASVLILATVGVGVVAVSALGAGSSIPSPSPIGAGSNSSQISSTTSSRGVSC